MEVNRNTLERKKEADFTEERTVRQDTSKTIAYFTGKKICFSQS